MADDAREQSRDQAQAPDQLSPTRALQESVGTSGSQRLGDSGPLANPTVSFPGEVEEDEA